MTHVTDTRIRLCSRLRLVHHALVDIQVRSCAPDEQVRAFEVCEAAFSDEARQQDSEVFKKVLSAERTFGAFEGPEMVGSGANLDFDLTIPGGSLPAAGVTLIGVLPSHRRRGILRKMMRHVHADALERGEPLAVLWASEENIYQRFGYGMAVRALSIEAQRDRIAYLEDLPQVGKVRMVSLEDAPGVLADVYDRVCTVTPGMFRRTEAWWRNHTLYDPEHHREGWGPRFCAVLELDGTPEAYAVYSVQGKWERWPASKLNVREAVATSPVATREMWRFIFGVDLIETVTAWWLPLDHPLPFLVSEPRRLAPSLRDSLWLRILDLPAAMEARSYATADLLVIEVSDAMHQPNSGTWRLDTTGDKVDFAHTSDMPDLRLNIRDLGAMYLGGVKMAELLRAGRGEEATDGAGARLDAMLATTVAPWCPEIF